MDPNGQYNQFQQVPSMQPPKTNGKAIAALVLGILSIVSPWFGVILGIIAIVFASLALRDIKSKHEGGRGLAIGGLVCGIVSIVLYGIMILIVAVNFVVPQ
ncbi:DUF4190 domain-containing protein [Paenibacillus azoreducens]|uniref:DUF4190 domain-containing protein n=1 Tax=Paenibacillus azoreducens TaxID=116718 RepID=A0A919YHC9_9BACL|nr:DUF4190 domain-containing protein [Paenibacillus azoreducens]GIO51227.1 hypothetical protein J34TS1_59920 [Paenibacillus azoreducens]